MPRHQRASFSHYHCRFFHIRRVVIDIADYSLFCFDSAASADTAALLPTPLLAHFQPSRCRRLCFAIICAIFTRLPHAATPRVMPSFAAAIRIISPYTGSLRHAHIIIHILPLSMPRRHYATIFFDCRCLRHYFTRFRHIRHYLG